jgi:hypothetical protein
LCTSDREIYPIQIIPIKEKVSHMSNVKNHFRLTFPSIDFTAMYAEMNNGTYTKTYIDNKGNVTSELIPTEEYLAAMTFGMLKTIPPKKGKTPMG